MAIVSYSCCFFFLHYIDLFIKPFLLVTVDEQSTVLIELNLYIRFACVFAASLSLYLNLYTDFG